MSLCPGNLSSYQSINYKKVGLTQKKNDASHATPTEKAHLCAVRDKQDPLSCLNEAGKLACVSPEERA